MTFFDTKLSIFGLAPFPTEEGAAGPQNSPKASSTPQKLVVGGGAPQTSRISIIQRVLELKFDTLYWYYT